MQEVLSVSNDVAAELAAIGDGVLDALRERLRCTIRLRGNQLTRSKAGRPRSPRRARSSTSSSSSSRAATRSAPTVDAVLRCARPGRGRPRRVRRRRLAPPRQEDRAEDRHAEALRRRDPGVHRHVRDRPGRHRQDLPGDGARGRRAVRAPGRPDHPHAARGRGRRAARLPAGRHAREGRPVPAAAVRRALRHARRRSAAPLHGARHDRGRAARVHARPHAERLASSSSTRRRTRPPSRCRCS